jgi:shikimate kinase
MAVRLVIIGLPGSGKTTVGAAVAALAGVPFLDSDDLVHDMTGRTAGDIIAADGEAAFRLVEATAIADTLVDFGGVLALGGGAVTTESVRAELRDAGVPVVLLTADRSELVSRIGHTRHRPLLAGDTAGRLAQLDSERAAFYAAVATTSIDTTALTPSAVAEQLLAVLGGEQP